MSKGKSFFLHTHTKMVLLDNSSFIIRLEKFANAAKKDSSFSVTFKRYNGHDKPKPREGRPALPEPETYMCLMRAQTKSKKISTIVRQEDVPKMMNMYAQFMKSNMDGLKRVKKVKSKAKAAKG
ncbi:signal recognition particle 14 kDa protein [Ceratitis capitata]|uniref:Signal recognition particle 14 kDa protein n=2 Tax=Ceratitis capitata TaxID=7213 RepID=W8AQW0_CERCA|nr:signal recognition particle 14 kDa protein [Ceratitis capitata]